MEDALPVIRRLFILALLAGVLIACDRFIDLTPPPDAHGPDAVIDTIPPDAATTLDGAAIGDAFIPPD